MMHHSSTSNSKTKLRPIRELVIIFSVLVVIEILIRVLVFTNWLPYPMRSWERVEYGIIEHQVAKIEPNIIVVGNSIARHGFDSNAFIEAFSPNQDNVILPYNTGMSGTASIITATFTEYFLLPASEIDTIIWIIDPHHLRPIEREHWQDEVDHFLNNFYAEAVINDNFYAKAIDELWWTWRYRSTLQFIFTNFRKPQIRQDRSVKYLGYSPLDIIVPEEDITEEFVSIEETSSPLDEQMLAAMTSLIFAANEAEIDLIFVIAPNLRQHYQNPQEFLLFENEIISQFEAYLSQFSIALYDTRDLSYDGILSFIHFEDVSHLNEYGAPIFTERVAEIYAEVKNAEQ